MANSTLDVKKYYQEGDLAHEYNPLHNIVNDNNEITDFRTDELDVDLNNPVNIECQPSYDGTVNLIVNDDKNPPRIINNRFTTLEDNRYRIINRNQLVQTNLYKEDKVDQQTRLFRNINRIPQIDFSSIGYHGQLMGGNYTFYLKYADNDYNQTDVIGESGIVSIFKGTLSDIPTISGTLSNERTDKAITLKISNIDTSFSKIYLYCVRETSNTEGTRISEALKFTKAYEIKETSLFITVNGFEETDPINEEELNIKYNLVTAVKSQTQVQNMLFFGNIQGLNVNVRDLQNISLYLPVTLRQSTDSIGWVNHNYSPMASDDVNQNEYYNPYNIYYKLGYWPGEIYRLGIVYILNDDSLSPVFNLRGHKFLNIGEANFTSSSEFANLFDGNGDMNYIPQDEFLNDNYLDNTKGVFRNPDVNLHFPSSGDTGSIRPLYYEVQISQQIQEYLQENYHVKGYFLVRQKRIPITLCQGLSVGIDKISYTPTLAVEGENGLEYIGESFLTTATGTLTTNYASRLLTTPYKQCNGILSVDANVTPSLRSAFDGTQYVYQKVLRGTVSNTNREYWLQNYETIDDLSFSKISTVFMDEDVPLKDVNGYRFSTRAGSPEDAKQFAFFGDRNYASNNYKLLRGIYCPFLGVTSNIEDNCIYNIRIQNYSSVFEREYFQIRGNDNSAFYAISQRFEIGTQTSMDIYRGDCFTSTVTVRLNRNFIDSEVPVNETIVDPSTWSSNYKGYNDTTADQWLSVNRADLNTVPLGTWITFKCLSNYNLGLRAEDSSDADQVALMGNAKSFYPLKSLSTNVSTKVGETWLLNDGYNATLGKKRNILSPNVPYIKDLYDNRIMFSNVQIDDDFRNAYRIFQGLSYKDIDRQYGAIVKILDWGVHLLCVFEHGLAIIPINEKALIQTSTDQSVHMYGAGVIQNQVSLISPDFGSTWQESIIRTPVGVYGVDTFAKKIWRYSDNNGLELISDMKIQRFLNDNITLTEKDKYPIVALKNVKTHFNNYKGDVLFTFYNEDNVWHMCYNERLDKWITRYSWTPLYSENINNIFYSLDKKRAEVLAFIFDNQNTESGIKTVSNEWAGTGNFTTALSLEGYDFYDSFNITLNHITSSYLDANGNEIEVIVPNSYVTISNSSVTINADAQTYLGTKLYYFKLNVSITPYVTVSGSITYGSTFEENIGVVLSYDGLSSTEQVAYDNLLVNGFYVHGRAGIFDEIDYTDNDRSNQILPTKWYNKQEVFEFEFVVNNDVGLHKIFDNLIIISNNVQPRAIDFEVIGDVYQFNKAGIYKQLHFPADNEEWDPIVNPTNNSQEFKDSIRLSYDPILDEYTIINEQLCLNMWDYGRMKGNIQYKEDSWHLQIDPILFKKKYKDPSGTVVIADDYQSTRIRDKFLKVRVKYTGEDLATITALRTLMKLSYA